MMSQYSAHFILTLRLFQLFIDCSITLYWCLLVSLLRFVLGFFHINACLLKLAEASVDRQLRLIYLQMDYLYLG